MDNMFRCTLASGGDGADLIVTCSQNFAGSVITCTDGSSYTKTQTCPSSSPYEVTFESIPVGTYTISGVVSGQTFTTTKTILDFDAALTDIPDGATVTPTNDVQILLHCANIWNKTYTTISQLLADTTSLLAVISDNNAVDYLVRSTTFATDVCANSTAMTYIGADDYCADTLLADSTWLSAICNSTYFESVLTTKVPTMTGDTTPSGECFRSSGQSTAYAYLAFDGNDSTIATTYNQVDSYIGYMFTSPVVVNMLSLISQASTGTAFTIEASNDGTNYTQLATFTGTTTTGKKVVIPNTTSYKYYRIRMTIKGETSSNFTYSTLQFYGRT